jgi:glycine dehydrogenase
VARRLGTHYPVLYTGRHGLVAHECILDLRQITKETGVTVDDVAKRLIDYGFHAPTMSFPVAGTLMIEPTESEDLASSTGSARRCSRSAPRSRRSAKTPGRARTTRCGTRRTPPRRWWETGRTRTHGPRRCSPAGVDPSAKYWAPVRRIDGAYGDRHLVCSCPAPEAYAD